MEALKQMLESFDHDTLVLVVDELGTVQTKHDLKGLRNPQLRCILEEQLWVRCIAKLLDRLSAEEVGSLGILKLETKDKDNLAIAKEMYNVGWVDSVLWSTPEDTLMHLGDVLGLAINKEEDVIGEIVAQGTIIRGFNRLLYDLSDDALEFMSVDLNLFETKLSKATIVSRMMNHMYQLQLKLRPDYEEVPREAKRRIGKRKVTEDSKGTKKNKC